MKKLLSTITLTLTLTILGMGTLAAQTARQMKVFIKGGLVDKALVGGDASISHSRTDLNGTVHDDFVSIVVTDAEGRTRQYLISQFDSLVMPNGRRVVFHGYVNENQNENENQNQDENENQLPPYRGGLGRGFKRTSFRGKFPGQGTGNVTFYWTEGDRIRLDAGYESRAEHLSGDRTGAQFVFDDADLDAPSYMVYYPGKTVTIPAVQTQTKADNTDHIGVSGDCGIATARINENENQNQNENENQNGNENQDERSYSFTLQHKAAYLCFLPHIDYLPSVRVEKIKVTCSSGIAGTFEMSEAGLYNGTSTSNTITLNLNPRDESDFFLGHNVQVEQESCAAYMVIAPQSAPRDFTVAYYVTDTLSRISKVYRQTFSFQPAANTVYPITCNIRDTEFRTIDLGLSCNWSNVNVDATEPSQKGSTFVSDAAANAALLQQTVVTEWLMPDADQRNEILTKCQWTAGTYAGRWGYFVEGAAVAREYGNRLRIFIPCTSGSTPTECLAQNYRPVEALMIDLGLPSGTKWAARNIGATSAEDYGYYFAWGETEPKENYSIDNYQYRVNSVYQILGNNFDISGTQNDAAVVQWGGIWQMPTKSQMAELTNDSYCRWTRGTINGVSGYLIEGLGTGNRIFLPDAGVMVGSTCVNNSPTSTPGASYWCSHQNESRNLLDYAWTLSWRSSYYDFSLLLNSAIYDPFNDTATGSVRYYGRSVRPVASPNGVATDGTILNIATDSTTWKMGDNMARLFGTLSSPLPITGSLKVGFIIGDNDSIVKATARDSIVQMVSLAGSFSGDIAVHHNVGYWYRAFVEAADTIFYGVARHYGYEMVDFGLPSGILWANMNVGAASAIDYGNYYAWGETKTKNEYTVNNYKHLVNGVYQVLGEDFDISGTELDAAHVNLGGAWRMPTVANWQELIDNCQWTWTSEQGVTGYRVSRKGKSIFLPDAGVMVGSTCVYNSPTSTPGASYWCSHQNEDRNNLGYAWTLSWRSSYYDFSLLLSSAIYDPFNDTATGSVRYYGRPVRAVASGGTLGDGTRLSVVTDSASWKYDDTVVRLYGTLTSSVPLTGSVTVGFVVGDSASVTLDSPYLRFNPHHEVSVEGSFNESLSVFNNMGYWYRAYLQTADTVIYGKARRYGYEMVDFGLPSGLLWANMNVGASSVVDYGNYYAWGETEAKTVYNADNYKHRVNGVYQVLGDEFDISGTEQDAAHVNMGGSWYMPTVADWQELIDNCQWTWTSEQGVTGYRVSRNGKSIFLPDAGVMVGSTCVYNSPTSTPGASYWCSHQNEDRNNLGYAWTLSWRSSYYDFSLLLSSTIYDPFSDTAIGSARYYGRPVRAVATAGILRDGTRLSVVTDSASWKYDDTKVRLYGTLSSTVPLTSSVTVGFVVGDSASVTLSSPYLRQNLQQTLTENGSFKDSLSVVNNKGYWYRAYLQTADTVIYGKARRYGYEMVDFGLPSGNLWANMNVGASTTSDNGYYYAWGETTTKDVYDLAHYVYYKNNAWQTLGDSYDISATEWDAAYVEMGDVVRMPTVADWQELIDNCQWTWTSEQGMTGYRVSRNGKSIFLPDVGVMVGSTCVSNSPTSTPGASYWCSHQNEDRNNWGYAWTLSWRSSYYDFSLVLSSAIYDPFSDTAIGSARYYGRTIRAVNNYSWYINDQLLHIQTDSPTWSNDKVTLRGTVSSGSALAAPVTVGFLVGNHLHLTTESATVKTYYPQTLNSAGSFAQELSLPIGDDVYYCAYIYDGTRYYYGKVISIGSREMVDLGLPSGKLWANKNLGATTEDAPGGYFAWGETVSKDTPSFSPSFYQWNTGSGYTDIGSDISGTQYDAARALWQGGWRMPTESEYSELINNCNWSYVTVNGHPCYKAMSRVSNAYVLFPEGGIKSNGNQSNNYYWAFYWTSNSSGDTDARRTNFYATSVRDMHFDNRAYGLLIKPIIDR